MLLANTHSADDWTDAEDHQGLSAPSADPDEDGLTNEQEQLLGSSPRNPDPAGDADADGLSNIDEFALGTNPFATDSDQDGLSDYEEVHIFANVSPLDAHTLNAFYTDWHMVDLGDTDNGGIPDRIENHYGMDIYDPADDTSGDLDGDGVTNLQAWQYGWDLMANIALYDTDNDGMSTVWELAHGFDPNDPVDAYNDPDSDFLFNLEEFNSHTDPLQYLTPGQTVPDITPPDPPNPPEGYIPSNRPAENDYEVLFVAALPYGLVRDNGPESNHQHEDDWDHDGATNLAEMTATPPTDPRAPSSSADHDGDGWTNEDEIAAGTDPFDPESYPSQPPPPDTDADGWTDEQEILAGTDPNDPNSHPEPEDPPEEPPPSEPENPFGVYFNMFGTPPAPPVPQGAPPGGGGGGGGGGTPPPPLSHPTDEFVVEVRWVAKSMSDGATLSHYQYWEWMDENDERQEQSIGGFNVSTGSVGATYWSASDGRNSETLGGEPPDLETVPWRPLVQGEEIRGMHIRLEPGQASRKLTNGECAVANDLFSDELLQVPPPGDAPHEAAEVVAGWFGSNNGMALRGKSEVRLRRRTAEEITEAGGTPPQAPAEHTFAVLDVKTTGESEPVATITSLTLPAEQSTSASATASATSPQSGVLAQQVLKTLSVRFEKETTKGSGAFYQIKHLPIFYPRTGVGQGVEYTYPESPSKIAFAAELVETAPDNLVFTAGGQTLTLEETGNANRIFESEDETVQVDLAETEDELIGAMRGVVAKIIIQGSESEVTVAREVGTETLPIAFSEMPRATIVNRTPVTPDDNNDGVYYVRLPDAISESITENLEIQLKSGSQTTTLNWQTLADGTRQIEPFVLLPYGAAVSTVIKTFNLAAGAKSIEVLLLVNGSAAVVAKPPAPPPPLLACALDGNEEVNVKDHIKAIDDVTTKKLGYTPAVPFEAFTIENLTENVRNHEVFYLMAHGACRFPDHENVERNWGFEGVYVYQPSSGKNDVILRPEHVAPSNQNHGYQLVFMNACAGADMSGQISPTTVNAFIEAFDTWAYVSWDKPTYGKGAAQAAVEFFEAIDGEESISTAVFGIKNAGCHPTTRNCYTWHANLTAYGEDTDITIDLSP